MIQVTFPQEAEYGELAGRTVTVPEEALALDGKYVPAETVKEGYVEKTKVQETVQQRLTEQAQGFKDSLLEDNEYVARVFKSKGIELDESGKPLLGEGSSAEEISAQVDKLVNERMAAVNEEFAPKIERLEALESSVPDLDRRLLHAEIELAARASGVLNEHFETLPGAPKSSMSIISQTEHLYGKDENGNWALKDGDGFVPASQQEAGRPNAGPRDYFETLKKNEDFAPRWFGDGRPGAKDVGDPNVTKEAGQSGGNGQDDLAARQAALRKSQINQF